jgi:PAS domain S-box-containing protein
VKHELAVGSRDPRPEVAALENQPMETRSALLEVVGGQVDAVLPLPGEAASAREARETLYENAERFRSLFASSATGIAVATVQGNYLQANAAYCRMLGYTENELKTLTFASLTHPDDLSINRKLRDELLAGERKSFVMEKRYLKKGGDIVWTRHSVSVTLTRDGEIATLLATAEDISERKFAEQALRNSEERLRLITNLVPHGIFAKDATGRHIFANPALAEMTGVPVEELIGKDDFDLLRDKAQALAYRADDLAVIRSGEKLVISEEPRTDLSGRTRFVQTIRVPFTLAETDERAVLGVCMDITERKRIDQRFRRLVDSNVQGVFFWNTNGQTDDANDAFLRMVGYSRADLEAGHVSWSKITPPALVEQDRRALRKLAETGVCEPYEKQFIHKDGTHVPVFVGPAMFEDNREEGFCFVLDLTERKKLEKQFLRAQRMESIGTLAGGVAHDLNNILTPIMLSIEALQSEYDTPGTQPILETIARSAQRGADILRQLLSFARGLEGQRVEVDPERILKELEVIIRETFPKDIQIRFFVATNIWRFLGDPTQVHQIFMNLCVNARDAMPNGGHLIINAQNSTLNENDVAMDAQLKPGRYVHISVTDTGTGIPQKIIGRIFEPFFTTKEQNTGTGLGLSTVIGIVKSHGGLVNVYSEPDKGTTFNVYLPAIDNARAEQRHPTQEIDLPRGNGETILVVDDETAILGISRRTLETFGYRVLTARDGTQALAIYAEKTDEIAVVLTDMMMPVMDGPSLIRSLLHINPTIKIVGASGLCLDIGRKNLAEPGIKHFLRKPYTASTLLTTIRAILDEV